MDEWLHVSIRTYDDESLVTATSIFLGECHGNGQEGEQEMFHISIIRFCVKINPIYSQFLHWPSS